MSIMCCHVAFGICQYCSRCFGLTPGTVCAHVWYMVHIQKCLFEPLAAMLNQEAHHAYQLELTMQGPRVPEVQAEPEETGKDSPDIVSLATAGRRPRRVDSTVEVKTPCALSAGRLLACHVIYKSECMCAARGLLSWICSCAGD